MPLLQLCPTIISFEDVPRSLGMKRETRGLSAGREATNSAFQAIAVLLQPGQLLLSKASIEAPVKRGRGRPPGWMINEERDRMMLMLKLGKCAKCKPRGRNKRCDPSHHDIATTEPAAVEQAPIESIPDMSTLPKDGVPI